MTAFLKKALSAALAASLCLPASAANTVSRPASVPAQAFQALVQTAPAGTPFAAALGATELSASDYLSPIRAADPALDQVLSARPEAAENVALWIQGMSALEREHAPASEPIPGRVASGAPERRPAGADTDEKGGAEKPSWRGLTRTQMWKAVVSAVGGLDRASLKSEAGLLGAGEKLGALMDLAAARPELGAAASPVALGASDAHPNVARGLQVSDDGVPRVETPEDFHELARGRFDRHSRSPELEETGRWRGYDEDGNFIEESLRPDGGSSYYYVSRAGARTLLLETTGARTSALDHGAVAALPELPPAPGYSYSDGVKNLFNGVFRMRGDTTEVRWVFLWDPVTGDFEHQPYEFVIPGHMKPRNNFYTGPLPRGLQYQKWGGRAEFVLGNGGVTLYFDAGGNMGPFPPALEKRFLDSFARTYHFPVHAVRIAGRAALERAGDPRAGAVKAATEEFERSFGVLPEWVRQSLEGRTLGSLRADAKDADAARIHRSVLAEFYLGRVIDEVVGGDPVLLGVSRNYPEVFIGAARSLLSLALAGFDGSLDFSGGGLAGRATWVRAWAREASPVIAASKGGAGLTLSFGLLSAYLREPALPPLTGRAMAHSVGLPDVASAVETLKIAGRWLAGGWQSEARFADQAVAALRAYAAIPGLATPELLQARIGEERAREQAVRVGALRVSGPARAYRRALRRMPVGERENFGAWLERAAAERGLRAAAAESGMEAGELLLHWVEADLSRLPAAWLAPGRLGWRAAAIRVLSWLGLRRLALRLFGAVSDEGLLRALALGGAPELLADARGLEPEEARAFAARAPWLGSTARKTTASAAPAARRESIGRWNPDWPKPTEAELAYAEAFLSRAAQAELAGDAFAREFRDRLHLKISSARALRAIFYLSPEWAATLAASFRSGNHGVWRDSMDLFRERGQEGKVEIGMVAALFELGLNAANAGARPEWKGVRYAGGYELEGLVGSYGQVSEEGRTHLYADLSSRLSDRALAELLSRAFEFRTRREKHRTRASVILEGLLLPLGARVRQLMPTLSRDLQRAISPSDDGQAAAPAAAAEPVFGAPRVAVPTARVSGKGVGRLVIVRGEPTLAQLMAIPAGSIVALEYLPKSDVRIGPFAGIITYRDEGETSHAQALARDIWGVPHALLPGPEAIADLEGQRVALKVPEGGGDPAIGGVGPDEPDTRPAPPERLSLGSADLSGPVYLPAGDPGLADPARVGHKPAPLNRLAAGGLRSSDPAIAVEVAGGSAFPFALLERLLEANGKLGRYRTLVSGLSAKVGDRAGLESDLKEIRRIIRQLRWEPLPEAAREFDWARDAGPSGVFVRGVNNAENPPQAPGLGSGTMQTLPNVTDEPSFRRAVLEALASSWSPEAHWERARYAIDPSAVHPAAWLVPSQDARYSFMIHTSRTALDRPGEMVLELAQGLGEALVSSDAEFAGYAPTRVVWDKAHGRALSSTPGAKPVMVTLAPGGGTRRVAADPSGEFLSQPDAPRLLAALARVGAQVEAAMGSAQEIEGVLKPVPGRPGHWTIVLLQTKPNARRRTDE